MAQDVVVNGTTYPDVETVVMTDESGNAIPFYPDAVRYSAQTLTEAQKAQARQNIGVPEAINGERGTGILKVTTAPSGYTTAIGSYTPKYRIALSTVTSQSKVSKVMVGDVIQYSYYQYHVDYLDSTYAYISATRISIRGATGAAGADGADGKDAAELLLPPDYYFENDYLPGKIAEVKALMDEAGADGTAFVMFSDSHMELSGSAVNGGNSGKLAYHVMNECQIPFVLNFGDSGSNSPQETEALCTESLEAFNTMVKPLMGRLFQILGNHDGAWGLPVDTDGDGTTETYPYNMAREKTFHRALQKNRLNPRAVMSANGSYYYIDDSGSRTRFLMLNTIDKPYITYENGTMKPEGNTMKGTMIRQAQVDWIIASLESVPEGWSVIACTHHPLHQNTVTVGQYVRGIFKAFRDKSTYSATYAGEYSEGGGAAYTNQLPISIDADGTIYNGQGWRANYRLNSSAAAVAYTGAYTTGFIPCTAGDVIRLKDAIIDPANPSNSYLFFYTASFAKLAGGGVGAMAEGGANYTSWKVSLDDNGYVTQFTVPANSNIAYMRFSTMHEITSASVVTVNEEIVESAGTSIDGLNISVDFSANKGGDFIALFDGHAHNDYHYTADSFLVDMIAIACDGRVSNNTYMTDDTYECRALGTVYEQVLDVVVINKAARTIKTVRIGAGSNREISY